MGNNGALSAITAVSTTYAKAYVYLPASAISTGSAAGWYYAVFSSTTAATIYNDTYTSGAPTVPSSPAAFATTGPGAFTQTTGAYIPGPQVVLAGNALSTSGNLRFEIQETNNNSATGKFFAPYVSTSTALGANRLMSFTTTTQTYGQAMTTTFMNGSLSVQNSSGLAGTGITQSAAPRTTANFATDAYLQICVNIGTATDTVTFEGCSITVTP
jgi:hypothetical protein